MRANLLLPLLGLSVAVPGLAVAPAPARAQDGEHDSHDLAKKLSNPISDLVSVPFQFNWDFGHGPDEDTWHTFNLQPVVPFHLSGSTNMIARLILPTISTPGETFAGDMVFSLFFSPAQPKGAIWGAGPVFQLPRTGGEWGAGPTFVVLRQQGRLTYGMLANHVWTFAGDEETTDLNQTFLQPFFAVKAANGMNWTLQSESTANWQSPDGEEWTIPVNFVVSKVSKFGPIPASYALGAGVFAEAPSGGPEWKLRTVVTLLLPSRK